MATEPTKPTETRSHERHAADPKAAKIEVTATVMDVTPFAVPAKDDKSPAVTKAEEEQERLEKLYEANREVLRKEGEQALEYVKQGETRPSESDLKAGMSHPSVANRPGFAPEPTAPYPLDEDRPLRKQTQEEQNAGKEALRA